MTSNTQMKQLVLVGVTAAFATLAFLGTTVIRIPIPASGGYFNLGDTFVMAAALLYGPLVGGLVGAIGPAMADALGFPQFILATAVVKGVEGILIGLIAGSRRRPWRAVIALAVGVLVLVATIGFVTVFGRNGAIDTCEQTGVMCGSTSFDFKRARGTP